MYNNGSIYQNTVRLLLEFGRFGIVSVIRAILAILIVFVPYNLWGVNYVLCNITGYSIGLLVGFILHRKWTFRSHGNWNAEVMPYLVIFGAGFLVNIVLLFLFAEGIELNKNVSQVIAICGFTTTNYLGNKFWTFSERRESAG